MLTRTIPLSDLRSAPYNPRVRLKPGTPAWNRLERSLREFSLVQPIVWNERTGHVVSGHQRVEVMKHLGYDSADCVVVDLPLEREKALNVTLNNSNVGSDWDPELLVSLLEELHALPDFDATLTGFDESDLRDLILAPPPELPTDEPAANAADLVHVTFEVPADEWEDVRREFDVLVAKHDLRLHVRR